jgi:hypothetical protein
MHDGLKYNYDFMDNCWMIYMTACKLNMSRVCHGPTNAFTRLHLNWISKCGFVIGISLFINIDIKFFGITGFTLMSFHFDKRKDPTRSDPVLSHWPDILENIPQDTQTLNLYP